jgi:hypothetical protein
MFAGLTSATLSDANIVLSWDAASDDTTPPEEIAFAIYSGSQTGAEDFSTPYAFTPAGATGAVVSNLASTQTYFWVVRAVDGSGNQDANTVEKEATPPDLVPPRFAGATKVTADSSHSLLVEWKPAHDNATSAVNMSYEVFVSASPDVSSFDFKNPNATSDAGQSSVEITGLDPETPYFVIARAVDQAGLVDDNTYVQTATTPEGVPPSFKGLKQVDALPEGVKLYWLSATDNASDVANITYNVYVSPDSANFTAAQLATPNYQTDGGVLSFVVPNLVNQKRYWFLVRARDLAGNVDDNTQVISALAISGQDTTSPAFNGTSVMVTSDSPSTLHVTWGTCTDGITDSSRLVYDIYVQTDASPLAADAVPTLVSAPGATYATIAGLSPQTTRYVIVRCRDEAGNALANNTAVMGSTLQLPNTDVVPPDMSASTVAVRTYTTAPGDIQPDKLHVTWTAAVDAGSTAAQLRYLLCVSPQQADCIGVQFNQHIYATSAAGDVFMDLHGLISNQRYYVYVRAEDLAGNDDTGNHFDTAVTPVSFQTDVAPVFFDRCNGCHSFGPSTNTIVNVLGSYVDNRLPSGCGCATGDQACIDNCVAKGGGLALVLPGQPQNSLIYRRINPLKLTLPPFNVAPVVSNLYTGPQEPRDAQGNLTDPLSAAEDGAIRDWITQGAFAN